MFFLRLVCSTRVFLCFIFQCTHFLGILGSSLFWGQWGPGIAAQSSCGCPIPWSAIGHVGAEWCSGRYLCLWQGVGTWWALRSLPTQLILWFLLLYAIPCPFSTRDAKVEMVSISEMLVMYESNPDDKDLKNDLKCPSTFKFSSAFNFLTNN